MVVLSLPRAGVEQLLVDHVASVWIAVDQVAHIAAQYFGAGPAIEAFRAPIPKGNLPGLKIAHDDGLVRLVKHLRLLADTLFNLLAIGNIHHHSQSPNLISSGVKLNIAAFVHPAHLAVRLAESDTPSPGWVSWERPGLARCRSALDPPG